MGTIQIDGSTPKLTIGNATAEDATILFDGNAQDFYIALDDSADDLLIGLGSTVGTTPIIAIDENKLSTFSGAITVGVDDTGHDVKLFGASAGSYALWDESANLLDLRGATAAGPGNLKLTTGELTVVDADVLGKIEFQAPLEASGTDAILVGASIWAEADDTFAAGVNNTDLVFALGKSEAAAEKFRFTADTEIGIAGANYGTDGQVLTSGGAGAAVAWEDSAGAVTALNNATQSELVTVGSTTTELDAEANLTFTGSALTCIGTITVGVDNTGHDVKFFGATSGQYMLWDESEDDLILSDNSAVACGNAKDFYLYHNGTNSFMVNATGDLTVDCSGSQDNDIIFKGNDGGADVTALTLDMSAKGNALFNEDIWCQAAGSTVSVGAAVDDGYILGSANDDVKLIGKTGSGLMRGSTGNELWWDGTQFYPGADDSYHLGHSSYRFDNIYATNGTIQTSDENQKENIADSSLGLDFVDKLRPVQFTWKNKTTPERLYKESDKIPDGKKVGDVWREAKTTTHSRRHYGLIAQEVEKVLSDNGIDTKNFAPFIKTKVQTLNEGTHEFTETSDYTYGMRYNELVGILIKSIQELSAKVKVLEG